MNKDKKFYEEIEEVNTMVEIAREYGEKILQATGERPDLSDFMTALYEAGYRKTVDKK